MSQFHVAIFYREMDSFRKNNLNSVENGHFRQFRPEFRALKWSNEKQSYINYKEQIFSLRYKLFVSKVF